MSDERLREAERRWKESGSVEDEARYLLERVRVGELHQKDLELAAHCGYEGARQALGSPQKSVHSLRDWVMQLERFGPKSLAVAALHAAAIALLAWERDGGDVAIPRDLTERARVQLESPTSKGSAELIGRIQDVVSNQPPDPRGASAWSAAVAAAFTVAWGGQKRAINAVMASAQILGGEDRVRDLLCVALLPPLRP